MHARPGAGEILDARSRPVRSVDRVKRIAQMMLAAVLALGMSGIAGAAPASEVVMVKVAPGADAADLRQLSHDLESTSTVALPGGWRAFRLDEAVSLAQARTALAGNEADRAIALDRPLRAASLPDDPLFGSQWALRNTGQLVSGQIGTSGADVNAAGGWAALPALAPVTVAVIDSGIDFSHPDLADAAWDDPERPGFHGWDFVTGQPFASSSASADQHGTHVAGIIAAGRDNAIGVAGLAPNARLMSLKFLNGPTGSTLHAIQAIGWAKANGARVINASFGGAYSAPLCDAVEDAVKAGIVFVAAAGNSSVDNDGSSAFYPASCPSAGIISVAASDNRDDLAYFSNHGTLSVDVAAPGLAIHSTLPAGTYGAMSGTSMAAPQVAGVAALLLGAVPEAGVGVVKQAFLVGAEQRAGIGEAVASGGRVDLGNSLSFITDGPPADATAPAPAAVRSPTAGETVITRRPRLSWTEALDLESGVDHYRLQVDGQTVGEQIPSSASSIEPPLELADGSHSWAVLAVNGRGLTSVSATGNFQVQATPPPLPGNLAPANGTRISGTRADFTWDAPSDPGVSVRVVVNGVEYQPGLPGRLSLIGLGLGSHSWQLKVSDAQGRINLSPVRVLEITQAAPAPAPPPSSTPAEPFVPLPAPPSYTAPIRTPGPPARLSPPPPAPRPLARQPAPKRVRACAVKDGRRVCSRVPARVCVKVSRTGKGASARRALKVCRSVPTRLTARWCRALPAGKRPAGCRILVPARSRSAAR